MAKCGVKLRGSPETGSDGDDSRMPFVPNGTKVYIIST